MTKCPACGGTPEPNAAFCGDCGAALPTTRPSSEDSSPAEGRPSPTAPLAPRADAGQGPRKSNEDDTHPSRLARARSKFVARLGLDQRRRRLGLAAFALWTLAAVVLGTALGYEIFNRSATHASGDLVIDVAAPSAAKPSGVVIVMPDVEGLTHDAALEALADSGVDPSSAQFADRPSAAPAGTVVAQTPLRGTHKPRRVSLELAAATTVPDLTGKSSSAASEALEQLEAQTTVVQVFDPNVPVDQIISTSPPAGSPLPPQITLNVSAAPSSVFLSDVRSESSDCSSSTSVNAAGKESTHAVTCRVGSDALSASTAEYATETLASALDATVGISDDSKPGSTARVEVLADGHLLAAVDVTFGQTKRLEVSLSGVLQLEIRFTGSRDAIAVLADAQLIGSPTGIAQLAANQP